MSKIPDKLRENLSNDPYYKKCARRTEGHCEGRITWEHAFTYKGRKIQARWAIIPLCWYMHLGPGLNKQRNREIAVSRATPEDRKKYLLLNFRQYNL